MKRCLLILMLTVATCCVASGQDKKSPGPKGETAAAAAVNFTEHIAPIVFNHCASCHRPGEIGPFPLLTYADTRKKGKLIQQVSERRTMPPWHPLAPRAGPR